MSFFNYEKIVETARKNWLSNSCSENLSTDDLKCVIVSHTFYIIICNTHLAASMILLLTSVGLRIMFNIFAAYSTASVAR